MIMLLQTWLSKARTLNYPQVLRRLADRAKMLFPGVLAALVIAMVSTFVSDHYGGPTLLFALLFGLAFHFLSKDGAAKPGIEFSAKTLLRIGVGLLGVRIGLDQIMELGLLPLLLVLGGLAVTFLAGHLMGKILKLTPEQAALTAGSVAICGASAAIAISAVLPKSANSERDTLFTVVAVTTLGTVAMILYPLLVPLLSLDANHTGMLFGSTIHDVAQVVGAGQLVSDQAATVATYVKLMRVAMLIPVVIVIAWTFRAAGAAGRRPALPWFLILFAVLAFLNSIHMVPKGVVDMLSAISRWCLICAIAALGVKTSFEEMKSIGWRSGALVIGETVALLVFVTVVILAA